MRYLVSLIEDGTQCRRSQFLAEPGSAVSPKANGNVWVVDQMA